MDKVHPDFSTQGKWSNFELNSLEKAANESKTCATGVLYDKVKDLPGFDKTSNKLEINSIPVLISKN